jgi:hypothetical protein
VRTVPQWKAVASSGGARLPPQRPRLSGPPAPGYSLNLPGAAAPDPVPPVACAAMDLRRLRAGEWLAAISGVALLVSLFLPWYGPNVCVIPYEDVIKGRALHCSNTPPTGWESMSAIDILLAFVAASGVLLAIVTATQRVPAVPVALAALISLFGSVGVILVLLRALDLPDWAGRREGGLWLGLAGALGIVAGAMLSMREEIRPGGARVEIEPIPAPRP